MRLTPPSSPWRLAPEFRFFAPGYRAALAAVSGVTLATALATLAESFLLKGLSSSILFGSSAVSAYGWSFDAGRWIGLLYLAFVAARLALGYALDMLQARLMIRARDRVETLVIRNLLAGSWARLAGTSIGDLVGRLATDLPRAMGYREQVIVIANAVVQVLAFTAFVAYHSVVLALLVLGTGVAGALLVHMVTHDAVDVDRAHRASFDRVRVFIDHLLRGAKEIRSNGLMGRSLARLGTLLGERVPPFMLLSRYLARVKALNTGWPALALWAVLTVWTLLPREGGQAVDAALLPPLLVIAGAIFADMEKIIAATVDLRLIRNSMERLATYEASDAEIAAWGQAEAGPAGIDSIALQGVDFLYDAPDGGARTGLRGATLALRRPSWVCLVGPSGAGKSTLVDLLLKELAPTTGSIMVNGGTPLASLSRGWLARHVSLVPQQPYLFQGSVFDNLASQLPETGAPADARGWLADAQLRGLLLECGLAHKLLWKVLAAPVPVAAQHAHAAAIGRVRALMAGPHAAAAGGPALDAPNPPEASASASTGDWREALLGTPAVSTPHADPDQLVLRLLAVLQGEGLLELLLEQALGLEVGLHGNGWSGGERQLICLVRGLAAATDVVVLDEPTSALDPASTERVIALLRRQASERLVLTVTHHVALMTACDHVVEIAAGRLQPRAAAGAAQPHHAH